ncbi:MAG: F0F1 ATP synthase subunit [Syntrophus sp. (in: bacteria)]|nr:F0F1 ATP synthase subunit [Syntrophus sp. (in: bacteria)]
MARVSSIGIAMVIAIFGCLYLGIWLDRQLETEPYLTLLFLLIGIAAGFRNMYVLVKRYVKDDKPIIKSGQSGPYRKGPPSKKA